MTDKCLYNVCLDNENSLNRKFREDRLDVNLDLTDIEIQFCKKMYNNIESDFLYNKYLLLLHAHLLQIGQFYNKKEMKNEINKYSNDDRIQNACKCSNMQRIDYKIFKKLVENKNYTLIYYYIKLKNMLIKLKEGKSYAFN